MTLAGREYLEGAAILAVLLGACGVAGLIAVRRWLPALSGAVAVLAWFVTTTASLVGSILLPGILGVLSSATVIVAACLIIAAVAFAPSFSSAAASPEPQLGGPSEHDPWWAWILAAVGAGAVVAGAVSSLIAHSRNPVVAVDALTFHLPAVARFLQSGSIWQVVQYTPDLSNGNYPQNGTLMMLAGVLPWKSAVFVRYVDVPFLAATGLALFVLARELGARRPESLLAAAAALAIPAVTLPALEQAQVDTPLLAWFSAGAVFLVRASRRASAAELALGGCALGLAFGTKWYGVAFVPVAIAAWLVAGLASARPPRQLVRGAGILSGAVALFGGIWLLRNWAIAGNPFFPSRVDPLGITIFDAPDDPVREAHGGTVSEYLFDRAAWRDMLYPAYRDYLGPAGALMLAGLVVTAAVGWRRRREPGAAAAAAIAVTGLAMALLYVKLPDSAFNARGEHSLTGTNSRYLVPALLAGAPCLAWLAGRTARLRAVVLLALVAAVLLALRRCFPGVTSGDAARGIALVIAAGAAGGALARYRLSLVNAIGPRMAALAATGAAFIVILAGGWQLRDRTAAHPYGRNDPVIASLQAHFAVDARIALGDRWKPGGVSPVLPSFGRRLGNRVDYLGRFVDGTLRAWTSREPFIRQLRRGRYDAVVIGRGATPSDGDEHPEVDWAISAGYRVTAESRRLVLLSR